MYNTLLIVSQFCMRLEMILENNGVGGNGAAVHSVTRTELKDSLAQDCLPHWSATVLLNVSSKQSPGRIKPFYQWRMMTLFKQQEAETLRAWRKGTEETAHAEEGDPEGPCRRQRTVKSCGAGGWRHQKGTKGEQRQPKSLVTIPSKQSWKDMGRKWLIHTV